MKRRLFMVLLLLVAGAIVNVAVAWAIVAYSTDRFSSDLSARESIATMQTTSGGYLYRERAADGSIRTRPEFPGLDHATEEYTATGIHYRITSSRGASTLVDVRAGWPVKALTRLINQPWQERLKRHPYVLHEPIWPGFAINTVFYAFVLWLLFAAPFALRRRRRIKRGLCPKCAYDLRNRPSESSVCPECGATLLNAA